MNAGIDTSKGELMGPEYELQQKFIGAVLPSASIIKKINVHAKKKGWCSGIVKEKRNKVSRFGPYTVYRLVPDGVFWVRDGEELEPGQIVAIRYHQKTGRALEIKKL